MIALMLGIEGGGKTALMTKFLRQHHLMGGEVWALPGYELMNNRGRVVSKLIYPEQLMGRLKDLQFIVVVADEIQNFAHHHYWQSGFADFLAGASAQRRKLQFNIFATCPEYNLVPPDMRNMFHVVFNCRDAHWRNKKIPVGTDIRYTVTDMRGMLSGYPGMTTREYSFDPRTVGNFYETFALVDPKYQHRRYKIEKEEILLNSNGNVVEKGDSDYSPDTNIDIARKIAELKAQQVKKLESWEIHKIFLDMGYRLTKGVKSIIRAHGVRYDPHEQAYLIE